MVKNNIVSDNFVREPKGIPGFVNGGRSPKFKILSNTMKDKKKAELHHEIIEHQFTEPTLKQFFKDILFIFLMVFIIVYGLLFVFSLRFPLM